MPEGHVIHRLAQEINENYRGREIQLSSPQGRFSSSTKELAGTRITLAEAWGKHLFISFSHPSQEWEVPDKEHKDHSHQSLGHQSTFVVWIHLGLIGTFHIAPTHEPTDTVRFRIDNGHLAADLVGPQWCRLITPQEQEEIIARLGADPLREDEEQKEQKARVKEKVLRSKRSIASLLMDQKLFAGVGNIYRAEVLFRQNISPYRPARELSEQEYDRIWEDLVELMNYGARVGRIDTVRQAHTPESMGRTPRKDDHGGEVYVYRRQDQECYICGSTIMMRVLEGRNLFWCPQCQEN